MSLFDIITFHLTVTLRDLKVPVKSAMLMANRDRVGRQGWPRGVCVENSSMQAGTTMNGGGERQESNGVPCG